MKQKNNGLTELKSLKRRQALISLTLIRTRAGHLERDDPQISPVSEMMVAYEWQLTRSFPHGSVLTDPC